MSAREGELAIAARAVNQNLWLVTVVAVGNMAIAGGFWTYISLAGFVAAFLARIVLLGRIAGSLQDIKLGPASDLLKQYWLNYFVVMTLLALPVWLASFVSESLQVGWTGRALVEVARSLIGVLTIFVLPIVFLRRVGPVAIPAGLVYLLRTWPAGVSVSAITLLAFAIGTVRLPILMLGGTLIAPAAVLVSIVVTYLLTIAFAAGCQILIQAKSAPA